MGMVFSHPRAAGVYMTQLYAAFNMTVLLAFLALAAYSQGWRMVHLPAFDYLTQLDIKEKQ